MKSLNDGNINSFSMDKRYVKNDGTLIWTNLTVSKVQLSTVEEEYVMGIILDITERKNAEIILEHLAFHDQTTNLFNRRYFEEFIEKNKDNSDSMMSIILVNVNGLKLINDAYGFKTGDLLLNKVADVLTHNCVESSLIARINSNEFVVIYNCLENQEIIKKVSSIYKLIEHETVENISISVSIGHATESNTALSYHELFKQAESRMLTEKLIVKDSTISRTIEIIMNSLFEKNEREMLHSKRVSIICGKLARKMGMDEKSIEKIKIAGLMHDIGKIGVSDDVLNKKDKLTDTEWDQIKKHSDAGFRILSSASEFSQIADCVLTHHERWDGKGYPKGLKGEEIPLFSRIIAVADSFDAMTSKRSYREALERRQVVDEMIQNSGKQFDPNIINIFMENFEEFVVI
jgi:diguanylate cyclase (GGDEF)-like protein/putative nucleotidyltransferase with HDIG domain